MSLDPEEKRHLEAAQGFADLGMFLEADGELDKVDPHVRHLPEILRLRLEIYLKLATPHSSWTRLHPCALPLLSISLSVLSAQTLTTPTHSLMCSTSAHLSNPNERLSGIHSQYLLQEPYHGLP